MMNEIVVMNVETGHYPTEARLCQLQLLELCVPAIRTAQIYLSQTMIGKL